MTLTELSLDALLDELAEDRETPGGGSALALTLAAAAAIVEMCARISAPSWADAAGAAAQAEGLRAVAAALVEEDARVYAEMLATRAAAGMLSPDQRDVEVGRAFAAAAEPPLAIARAAADVADLADAVAAHGDERVQVDAAVAANLAAAAARGCLSLVAVNLTATAGDPRVVEATQLADSAARAAARALARPGD